MEKLIKWQKKQTGYLLTDIILLRNLARLNHHYADEHMHHSWETLHQFLSAEALKDLGIEEKYQWLELQKQNIYHELRTPSLASSKSVDAYEVDFVETQDDTTSTPPPSTQHQAVPEEDRSRHC